MASFTEQYLGELILAYLGSVFVPAATLAYRTFNDFGKALSTCSRLAKLSEFMLCDAKVDLALIRKISTLACLDCKRISDDKTRFGRVAVVMLAFSGYLFLLSLASSDLLEFFTFFVASIVAGYMPVLMPLHPVDYASFLSQAEAELELMKNVCTTTKTGQNSPKA